MDRRMEDVTRQYNQFVCHRVMHLIDEAPTIAQSITSEQPKDDWCIDLVRVREDAAALCPERLAQSKRTALGFALLAIGEKNEGVRILATDTGDDHPW